MLRSRQAFALSLLVLTAAPLALAQPAPKHKPKKGNKAAATDASASASASSASATPSEPEPPPSEPVPSASSAPASAHAAAPPESAPPEDESITNTKEDPNRRYLFVGLRYRGTVIPQFIENIFVNEGGTVFSNSFGAEFDIRKGGQSTIPWIQYTDYNTGDLLFLQKGQDASNAGYYSNVNSSLKAIYLGLDELWSVPVANHLDFEFGFGVGVGYVFGSLENNWVYQSQNGTLSASNGNRYSACPPGSNSGGSPPGIVGGSNANGCLPSNHTNSNPAKVGGYNEPNWFNGGGVPAFFPHISIPQISVRYKPIKQLETRLSVGFSLTGFWFGLSADYGLEKSEEAGPRKSGLRTRTNDTL